MKTTRKRCSGEFKAKVVLEGLRGNLMLAARHGVHHTMIAAWKPQAIDGLAGVFDGSADSARAAREAEGGEDARQDRAVGGAAGFFRQSLRSMSVGPKA
jgi:transposase